MTYPGKPVPLNVANSLLVGDMPGAVNVNRSTFNVENSGLPKANGRRSVVAALAPDYRPSVSVQAPAPWHSEATPTVNPISAPVPSILISHSPAASGRYIGSPNLAHLPNGDYVAAHDFFGLHANHREAATTLTLSLPAGLPLTMAWAAPTAPTTPTCSPFTKLSILDVFPGTDDSNPNGAISRQVRLGVRQESGKEEGNKEKKAENLDRSPVLTKTHSEKKEKEK